MNLQKRWGFNIKLLLRSLIGNSAWNKHKSNILPPIIHPASHPASTLSPGAPLRRLHHNQTKRINATADARCSSLTVFADEEVQVAVGVGHSHFGFHLWSLEGGVDLPWTALLWCQLHFAQAAAHGSLVSGSVHGPCRSNQAAWNWSTGCVSNESSENIMWPTALSNENNLRNRSYTSSFLMILFNRNILQIQTLPVTAVAVSWKIVRLLIT